MSLSSYQLVNFFGGPGSGKGTQAFKFSEQYGLTVLGMSSMLKSFIAKYDYPNSPELDRVARIQQRLTNGELVDFEDVKVVMEKDIKRMLESGEKLLFEGFPRNTEQAAWFAQFLEQEKIKTLFIHLTISLDAVLDRIKNRYWIEGSDKPYSSYNEALAACVGQQKPFQRDLDTDTEIIKKRFAIQYTDFKDEILAVMGTSQYIDIVEIDADKSPDAVFADAQKAFNSN